MEIVKIANLDVSLDFSNQFVIARLPEKFQDWERFRLITLDIVAIVARKLNVNFESVELIAVSENDEVIVHSLNFRCRRKSLNLPSALRSSKFLTSYDNVKPELIIEKMKEMMTEKEEDRDKISQSFSSFYEVIVDPSSGSEIHQVVEDMKALSQMVKMPVCAKFNGKNLRITSATDTIYTVDCFMKNINTETVYE